MSRRRLLMHRVGDSPVLPSEYQRVEWIGHERTTGIYLISQTLTNAVVKGITDIEIQTTNTNFILFSRYTTSPSTPFANANNNQSSFVTSPARTTRDTPRTIYTSEYQNNTLTKLAICGWTNNTFIGNIKLYGVQFFDSANNLIYNGVPCYRLSDDEIGLYDTVNNAFTTRVGTWTKGADI